MSESTWERLQTWVSPPSRSSGSSRSGRRGQRRMELTPVQVNVLEQRTMLTASITIDLSGSWSIDGQTTSIQQTNNSLTLTNEKGSTAYGHVVSDTQVVADGWNGLTANVVNGNTINWANGTTWVKNVETVPNISGNWYINNQLTSVGQSGSILTFTNENGAVAQGHFTSPTQIVAEGWGGLNASMPDGTTINWANGTTWTREVQTYPNLSGSWYINNQLTTISGSSSQLLFTNERGGTSAGRFLSSNQVIADDWGGLTGTVVGSTINWSNGSTWGRTPQGAPPALPVNWTISGHGTSITSDGSGGLVLTNEFGGSSSAYYQTPSQIVAADWGNLVGILNPNHTQISWGNGSTWNVAT